MDILVADDHGLFRQGLRSLIETREPAYRVHCAEDLASLERALASASFRLILLDLAMPGMQGVDSIRLLSAAHPDTPILVVSAEDAPETMHACIRAGAEGYLPKSSDMDTMLQAINIVLAGGQYIPRQARRHKALSINHRQEQILRRIAQGKSNREIACELQLTEGTVKQYVSGLLRLLDVDNRVQAGNMARKLLGPDTEQRQ